MKTISKNSLLLICSIILLATSCQVEKRRYSDGYYINRSGKSVKAQKVDSQKLTAQQTPTVNNAVATELTYSVDEPVLSANLYDEPIVAQKSENLFDKNNKYAGKCDIITLKSGEKIEAIIIDVAGNDVKYKNCSNQNGPTLLVERSNVETITYANESKNAKQEATPAPKKEEADYVKENPKTESNATQNEKPLKMEWLGFFGFLSSLTGLLVAGIPLGSLGMVFGIISLIKIQKHPEKYKQKRGFAIAALIIGLVAVVGAIIFLLI